MYPNVNLFGSN